MVDFLSFDLVYEKCRLKTELSYLRLISLFFFIAMIPYGFREKLGSFGENDGLEVFVWWIRPFFATFSRKKKKKKARNCTAQKCILCIISITPVQKHLNSPSITHLSHWTISKIKDRCLTPYLAQATN
ncbi:hypothetical protein L6452_11461 [Arctium lappa]|uniref:Uncharacterized protein n=1 Tax=Arctium lappa TaxID=4217 RepID=A0ACB9DPK7_ARCLA|nr:hypothetical protein L6452_11461 [Arctium lappa]